MEEKLLEIARVIEYINILDSYNASSLFSLDELSAMKAYIKKHASTEELKSLTEKQRQLNYHNSYS